MQLCLFDGNFMSRKNISSGAKWENIAGYSRAVRIGNSVEVTGTTAVDGDRIVGEGDGYEQAKFIFQRIEKALQEAGANLSDVVRTRMFVTDIREWESVARAHREIFKDIKPVTTMVEVSRLIDEKLLVEIEVTAIIE